MGTESLSLKDLLDSNILGRCIAILLIVLSHLIFAVPNWTALASFASAGKLGVSLFVFYAGFLHQFRSREKGNEMRATKWLIRRIVRIFPTFWVGLFLTILVGVFFNGKRFSWPTILSNVVGVHLFVNLPVINAGYTSVYWFSALILLCYVLFIVARNVRRKSLLVIASTSLSIIAIYLKQKRILPTDEHYAATLAFPMFFWGMWISDKLFEGYVLPGNQLTHFICTFLLFGLTAIAFKSHYFIHVPDNLMAYVRVFGLIGLSLSTIMIFYSIGYLCIWLNKNARRLLRMLLCVGNVSFAIYCLQEPALIILARSYDYGYPVIGLLIYAIILGALSWVLNLFGSKILFLYTTRGTA